MSIMEDIRSANKELRDWGNAEYLRAEEAEEELNSYQTNLVRAQEEIKYLEEEISKQQIQE
jgi:hypothetical protein